MTIRAPLLVLASALLAAVAGCTGKPASSVARPAHPSPVVNLPDGPGVRVLFLGNSLTAGNDLPGLVGAMAAAGGVTLHARALTPGGTSLEDHWQNGVARQVLAATRWDFLVLQQGPSTRPDSQANLKEWAARWAEEARSRNVTPAMFMVWPIRTQPNGFDFVSQSYRAAATAAGAKLLPAGDAWREAFRRDPALPLCLGDDFHPSPAGSYLAALIVTHGLTGVPPRAVPARLVLASGAVVELPEEQAETLRRAAEAVIAAAENVPGVGRAGPSR